MRKSIIKLIKESAPFIALTGKVEAVNESNYTCDVLPDNGTGVYYNVRLKAKVDGEAFGFIEIPEINSPVIFLSINNENTTRYIVHCDKVSEYRLMNSSGSKMLLKNDGTIEINGSNLGGLPTLSGIIQRLNAIENKFNVHTHSGNGVATTQQMTLSVNSNIENTKIKQGG